MPAGGADYAELLVLRFLLTSLLTVDFDRETSRFREQHIATLWCAGSLTGQIPSKIEH